MLEDNGHTGPEHAATPMGQYYLLDKLAQGGMAEIYKGLAYDLHGIKKTVVIKKILPEIAADPEFVQMLINEAKIAVQLTHGNIAQIYDLGKVGDDYFMVMEYVDGKSLSQIHRRSLRLGSSVPIEYACYFISEVTNGLNYMHRRTDEGGRNLGIVHRDISPQNIIISYSGTVKIIDFGIAKAAIQINITDSGILKGKFAYMSPEQAKGEHVDHRTDIFSLGVILHEILTGRRLFKSKNKRDTLKNVRRADVPVPSSIKSDIPPELDRIVMKALAKDPKNRYMWASELHDDLVKFLHAEYPDFQTSAVTDYIRNLFRDEVLEKEALEQEAKTPFLIIDHTQSAILPEKMETTGITKVPPQLAEFMLDDETPLPNIKMEEIIEEEETKKKINLGNVFKPIVGRWKAIAISAVGVLVLLSALFVVGINIGWMKTPNYLSWLRWSAQLKIHIEPKDAEVTFGGVQLKGGAPYKLRGLKEDTPYRLIVEKKGYIPELQSVSLSEGKSKTIDIILKPEPPHFATLTITSKPEGAKIFLNEKETSLKTPAKLTSLTPNEYHSIGLFLKDRAFWNRDILLKPDEEKTLDVKLEINYGELQIISTPPDADVSIDGKVVGKTPFIREKIAPETLLDIIVSKKGFSTWSSKVRIEAGRPLTLRPKLDRGKELLVPHFLRNLDKPTPEKPEVSNEMLPPIN